MLITIFFISIKSLLHTGACLRQSPGINSFPCQSQLLSSLIIAALIIFFGTSFANNMDPDPDPGSLAADLCLLFSKEYYNSQFQQDTGHCIFQGILIKSNEIGVIYNIKLIERKQT